MRKFKAKSDCWFDEGSEAILECDYSGKEVFGLFSGIRFGKQDEEVCRFDEFEEIIDDHKIEKRITESVDTYCLSTHNTPATQIAYSIGYYGKITRMN